MQNTGYVHLHDLFISTQDDDLFSVEQAIFQHAVEESLGGDELSVTSPGDKR